MVVNNDVVGKAGCGYKHSHVVGVTGCSYKHYKRSYVVGVVTELEGHHHS